MNLVPQITPRLEELVIDDTQGVKTPVSPTTRSPNFALRGFDLTGNQSLDNALAQTSFKPRTYFIDADTQAAVFLLGMNNNGINMLIRLDQPGIIHIDKKNALQLKEKANSLANSRGDLQAIGALVEGIAYVDSTNVLCLQTNTSGKCWTIYPPEQRLLSTALPWLVVPYTTLVSSPQQTANNLIIATDKVINYRSAKLRKELEQQGQRLSQQWKSINTITTTIDKAFADLTLSTLILYNLRANQDPAFCQKYSAQISKLKHVRTWSELKDNNLGSQVRNMTEQALATTIKDPVNRELYLTIEECVKTRFRKIEELCVVSQRVQQELAGINLDLLSELQERVTDLGEHAFDARS